MLRTPLRFLLLPILGALLMSPASAAADASLSHVRVSIRPSAPWPDLTRTAARHDYVVLHAWQTDRMRELKAANPALRVLVYKNLSNTNDHQPVQGFFPTGVEHYSAARDHPEWFLTDQAGERVRLRNHSYLWAMDVGNAEYQAAWANNVAQEIREQGWDGVFMDDVNPTIKYHADPLSIAKYPGDRAYSAATRSAVKRIVPQLRQSGALVFGNIGAWVEYPKTGSEWLRYMDGAMEEKFVKFGNAEGQGYRDEAQWTTQLNVLKDAERRGKVFVGITASSDDDAAAARYGLATMLLGSDGKAAYALQDATDYGTETWFPDYDLDVGKPLGPEKREPSGVHRRRFSNGQVLVNPTLRSVSVDLGGVYSGTNVKNVTRVKLAPRSAAVLTRVGALKKDAQDVLDLGVARATASGNGVASVTRRLTTSQTRRLLGGKKLPINLRVPSHGRLSVQVRHKLRGAGRMRVLAETRRTLGRGGRHRIAVRGRKDARYAPGRATLYLRYAAAG